MASIGPREGRRDAQNERRTSQTWTRTYTPRSAGSLRNCDSAWPQDNQIIFFSSSSSCFACCPSHTHTRAGVFFVAPCWMALLHIHHPSTSLSSSLNYCATLPQNANCRTIRSRQRSTPTPVSFLFLSSRSLSLSLCFETFRIAAVNGKFLFLTVSFSAFPSAAYRNVSNSGKLP